MELGWSFGGSGFIGADTMVRGHFSIFFSDSYVGNFVSYLVVVVKSLCELYVVMVSDLVIARMNMVTVLDWIT